MQAPIVERSHARRGYEESPCTHSHVAYHALIGRDGTIRPTRCLTERTGHTRNQDVNIDSIAVVLAGNFEIEGPKPKQLASLKKLVSQARQLNPEIEIIGHREASPTSCPGKHLEALIPSL